MLAVAIALAGCTDAGVPDEDCPGCELEGTCGERGVLRFVDRNDDPALPNPHRRGIRPVAVGAHYELELFGGPDLETVERAAQVSLTRPVFEVLDLGRVIELRAISGGGTTMDVVARSTLSDSVALSARKLESIAVVQSPEYFTWTTLGLGDPAEIPVPGYALLPEATVGVSGLLRDADGEPLGGHGLVRWTVEPREVVDVSGPGTRSDAVEITSRGGDGSVRVAIEGYGGVDITLVSDSTVVERLALYEATLEDTEPLRPLGDQIELTVPEAETDDEGGVAIVVLPFDTDGAVVVAPSSDDAEFTLVGGDVITGESLEWSNVFAVTPVSAGEAVLEITMLGLTEALTIVVAD